MCFPKKMTKSHLPKTQIINIIKLKAKDKYKIEKDYINYVFKILQNRLIY